MSRCGCSEPTFFEVLGKVMLLALVCYAVPYLLALVALAVLILALRNIVMAVQIAIGIALIYGLLHLPKHFAVAAVILIAVAKLVQHRRSRQNPALLPIREGQR